MSNLLDEALIDAEALRETALKNAEAVLLEKFSDQIRGAVDLILEAPEDEELGLGDEMDLEGGEMEMGAAPEDEEDAVPEMPLASHEGVKLCPCPEDEEVIELDFDELEQHIGALETGDEEVESSEDVADELLPEALEVDKNILEELLDNVEHSLEESELEEMAAPQLTLEEELLDEVSAMLDENWIDSDESTDAEKAEASEEDSEACAAAATVPQDAPYELGENMLEELAEALTVDIDATRAEKSGWGPPPESVYELAEEQMLAMLQDSERRERHDEMQKAIKSLQESNNNTEEKNTKLVKDRKELLSITRKMKEKLYESNLTNSKLLYTNKVLMNDSLNERQKTKIAEALSNANTVEEAKTIYETLQSATGVPVKKEKPESLSEAVNKVSSTLILSHRKRDMKEKTQDDSSVERWKILAGLNNKQ